MVVNAAGARLDYRTCVQCYTGGLFATLFLPSIIGGDVVRLAVGFRRSPNPAAVFAGNVVDRFLDMSAQGGLVLLGLILLPVFLPASFARESRRSIFVLVGFLVVVVLLRLMLGRTLLRGGWSGELSAEIGAIAVRAPGGWRRPQVLVFGWYFRVRDTIAFLILTALLADFCVGYFYRFACGSSRGRWQSWRRCCR